MKKIIFFILFVLVGLCTFAQNSEKSTYKVGDKGPGGGTIFYIEGTRYFECSDNLGKFLWREAKIKCRNYRGGGYCNWRMATKDELKLISENLFKTGIITHDGLLWSSSSVDNGAWNAFVNPYGWEKESHDVSVRAVRTFTIE